MNKAKAFAISIAVLMLTYGALGFLALPFASFEGDLSRMAPLPERQFGWLMQQPALVAELLNQAPLSEADVLVIGDSFSDPRVWQSVLVGKGLKVRTELWGSMPFICNDLGTRLRSSGFKGEFVIIESVERNLSHRLKDSLQCSQSQYRNQTASDALRSAPVTRVDREATSYDSKLLVGIHTLVNAVAFATLQENMQRIPFMVNDEVAIKAVDRGCQLFSHPACSHALFYASETESDHWQQNIQSIQELNVRLGDIKPIWVVIPNKTTVYLYPQKQLWTELHKAGLGPNLLHWTSEALSQGAIDLFPGNNTHFSTEGYLQLGREVARSIDSR